MSRRSVALLLWGSILCVTVLVLFVPFNSQRWSGAITQCRIRLTFTDSNGYPVPGVKLRVERTDGTAAHFFPITDYRPNSETVSDERGVIEFYHVSTSGELYGGVLVNVSGTYRQETVPQPEYVCRFLHDGQEVFRIRHDELLQRPVGILPEQLPWDWSPYLTAASDWTDGQPQSQQAPDSSARLRHAVSRETYVVRRLTERAASAVQRDELVQLLKFWPVERAIVIP